MTTVARMARARAMTIGRRRGSIWRAVSVFPYRTVMVPVMFGTGWIEQMKV